MRNLRSHRFLFRLAAGAGALLVIAPIAAAAQTTEAPAAAETVFRWLNFLVVFGLGGWWAWGKLKGVFRRNADRIAAAIGEAELARQAAQARLRAAEEKFASLDREAAELRERARRDSAAEALRIRELAREEAVRIERAADAEIAAAELAAAHRLREMAIDRTIEFARAGVVERLTPEAGVRLVGRFVDAVSAAGRSL
jgi:F0F1-type ATP synthase membrane subunit b/b'